VEHELLKLLSRDVAARERRMDVRLDRLVLPRGPDACERDPTDSPFFSLAGRCPIRSRCVIHRANQATIDTNVTA